MIELQQFLESHLEIVCVIFTVLFTSYLWYSILKRQKMDWMQERLDHIKERTELIEELVRLKEKEPSE